MKRCLFVDDSSVIRMVAKKILSGPGMLVAEAATAREALDICAHEMPEIVIVDHRLPDMDSCQLIARLNALGEENRPVVLLCMCEFDVGLLMRAKRAGAQGYVMKPFTRPQLLEGIRESQVPA
ncbi:response regulator [Chelativorans sp. AA-79]|uniref:response regulator n=1 Tax=Chelativorans sp. AA-79 TaxID=3028735 RepID=UPI0023F9B284|nr:response regulator [Chelativorans sp. AA-79]WEX07963.1 response regulator [Chelativorans sp. AA-79]